MKLITYLTLSALLLLYAYIVFRHIVRRDYIARGRLNKLSSILQFLVFAGIFGFPYQFNTGEWVYFWKLSSSSSPGLFLAGLIIICIGCLVTFGTMLWLGISKTLGVQVDGLQKAGPYRISRNPQVTGGYILVIGISLQWPSLYALGWIVMYAVITYMMIVTEEEHLLKIFGKEYEDYCAEVPRYLLFRRG